MAACENCVSAASLEKAVDNFCDKGWEKALLHNKRKKRLVNFIILLWFKIKVIAFTNRKTEIRIVIHFLNGLLSLPVFKK